MKWSRLWQPRHPAFWLMLAFNLLSSLLAWVLRSVVLPLPLLLLLALVALGNVALGLWAAWLLLKTPREPGH